MISRPFKEGFSGVGRHWAMSISSALAVTITLMIISLISTLSINLEAFTKSIENTVQISVQVDYAAEGNEANIKNQIMAIDGVSKVNFSYNKNNFHYYKISPLIFFYLFNNFYKRFNIIKFFIYRSKSNIGNLI